MRRAALLAWVVALALAACTVDDAGPTAEPSPHTSVGDTTVVTGPGVTTTAVATSTTILPDRTTTTVPAATTTVPATTTTTAPVATSTTEAATTTSSLAPGVRAVADLSPGVCFDEVDDTTVDVVPCDQPHEREVIAVTTVAGSAAYPGVDEVDDAADASCVVAFSPYVGVDYAASSLLLDWYVPGEESWEEGDRRLVCVVYDLDRDQLVGSVAGSGR